MSEIVRIESPLDLDRLRAVLPDTWRIQLDQPLTTDEYRALAAVLQIHPDVILRAYGFSEELATLSFLRHFPKLRRFSISDLDLFNDTSRLNDLPDELDYLDLGETEKPLDLRPIKFSRLRELRVAAHHRGLDELLNRNRSLRALSLWQLKADRVVPHVDLPNLESLAISLGSLSDPKWLGQFRTVRHLALRRVRSLSDLSALQHFSPLEWLRLEALPGVTALPDLSACTSLVRIDLDSMRGLSSADSLEGVAAAPNLDELLITESRLPIDAFHCLIKHPTLSAFSVGLGNLERNRQVETMLDRAVPRSMAEFAHAKGIVLVA